MSMTNVKKQPLDITLEDTIIEQIEQFIYLSQCNSKSNKEDQDVLRSVSAN